MHGLHTFASLKHGSCTIEYVLFNGISLNQNESNFKEQKHAHNIQTFCTYPECCRISILNKKCHVKKIKLL